MKTKMVTIDGREIGAGAPPWIVAEMSANHNGDLDRALAIIEAAKVSGADAIKLQTYTPDTLTIDHDQGEFRVEGGLWDGYTLYRLYDEAQTPWDWHEALFAKGRELGLTVFSSPFDASAVDFLEGLDAPAYKIASFEAIDLPLIEKAASTGKPLVISTGIANLQEIDEAVQTARSSGTGDVVLLHCVSGYPTPAEEANLRTIADLQDRFNVAVGLSDHTLGIAVSIAAIAAGAAMIEKHFTLSRADGGPDSTFSLEPAELTTLCESCRTAWSAMGRINYDRKPSEKKTMYLRRSLYAVEDIQKDAPLTTSNVRSIRPGLGLPPKYLPQILGKRAAQSIQRGTALTWSLIDGGKS